MAQKQILNFINGEFVAAKSGKTFEDRSPVDNRLVGTVSEAGEPEVDAAVKAARAALNGPWGSMDIAKRSELLYAVADEINRRFNDFLEAEVADTGKPHSLATRASMTAFHPTTRARWWRIGWWGSCAARSLVTRGCGC